MPLARVGDVELSYERAASGDGAEREPLLMIMGMSGTLLHWDEFLPPLQRNLDTIVYDHRGVGQSSRLEGQITIAQLAQDAIGLLDALEIERAHVLGISMGGMIAQELVLAAPERVRTLTLGCTYCGGPGSALAPDEVTRLLGDAMASGDRARAIRAGWEVNVGPGLVDDPDAYARFTSIAAEYAVAIPVVMAQMAAVLGHDTHERLPGVQTPTLVIHGTEDRMLPVQNGRMVASLIPGSQLEVLDGVGHLFFWERADQSAQVVLQHARAHAGTSSGSKPLPA
jgi:pimeloyl-ACP methyl ester carboxylesterase